ncbi:MAG: hypothetical protein LJE68_14945 [Rhodobacter sp.]|nr:hypothetical protein [Rhodobacter sp.]
MTGRIILALMVVGTLANCSRVAESRLNPFNWFGRSERTQVVVASNPNADPRKLVAQIITLRVEKVPGGAIVRATGLPTRQGYYDGELLPVVAENAPEGVLSYEFRISPPLEQTRVSTQQSREVVVALFVSEQSLAGVRQIRVSAASNALVVRR